MTLAEMIKDALANGCEGSDNGRCAPDGDYYCGSCQARDLAVAVSGALTSILADLDALKARIGEVLR